MNEKKAYPLRINAEVLAAAQRWAADDQQAGPAGTGLGQYHRVDQGGDAGQHQQQRAQQAGNAGQGTEGFLFHGASSVVVAVKDIKLISTCKRGRPPARG